MSETAAVLETLEESLAAFEYTPLADVDPKFKSTVVPAGDYKLEIVSAKKVDYVVKEGSAKVLKGQAKAGDPAVMIKFDLIIVDHEEFSGRHVFPVLFPSPITLQQLRRVSDATGYQQEQGQSIYTWLEGMERQSPRLCFETAVSVKDAYSKKNADGTPEQENDVAFKSVKPASR